MYGIYFLCKLLIINNIYEAIWIQLNILSKFGNRGINALMEKQYLFW